MKEVTIDTVKKGDRLKLISRYGYKVTDKGYCIIGGKDETGQWLYTWSTWRKPVLPSPANWWENFRAYRMTRTEVKMEELKQ